ncbi:uncharacterized protein LOC120357660 [Solenopsis invicta]|uniref:uncharacterized protein LOC120357660 n=1 Tax=Solenopsis invicta TaxID=13686 RepID=UPI00193CE290|nr:uncharacterized protein LOC120357660 [Solenopsis invicta]XP_039304647.1 uncharacterized protein LOC120357660 [Solenopsis invicta]
METKIPAPLEFSGNIAENYKKFKQRVDIYMTANDFHKKSEEVKVAIFLNTIGEEGIDIFNNFQLSEVDQKKYDLVVKKFDEYFLPKKNVVYESFLFYKKVQESNEPVDNFVKELKKLARNCEFPDEQDMIRDRLVLGIADTTVQEKLLSVTDLKLEKAIETARAKEMLKERIKTMQNEKIVEKIEKNQPVKAKGNRRINYKPQEKKEDLGTEKEFQCRRCTRKHGPRECPAFGRRCNKCGKVNHFEASCRLKGIQEIEDKEEEEILAIKSLNIVRSKIHQMTVSAWLENIEIENKIIKFKIDTGAQVNILPDKVFNSLNKKNILIEKTNVILEAYRGHKFKPLGKVWLSCKLKNCVKKQEFILLKMKEYRCWV